MPAAHSPNVSMSSRVPCLTWTWAGVALVLALAALSMPSLARAQSGGELIRDASVDEFRDLLLGGATTKSFRRTQPPTVNGLCPGSGTAGQQGQAASSKNLVPVPYAPSGPGVQMAIEFAHASDALTTSDQQLLDKLASAMRDAQLVERNFAVAGHTDATGSDAINLELSCARSLAVKRFLVSRGVAGHRLSAYGFGSGRPLELGAMASARNRRVEVRRHDGTAP
jgi:outer membrane protein OmpA-like peptidoglycan-associated protein